LSGSVRSSIFLVPVKPEDLVEHERRSLRHLLRRRTKPQQTLTVRGVEAVAEAIATDIPSQVGGGEPKHPQGRGCV
jgi:uncharacterized membrane protein